MISLGELKQRMDDPAAYIGHFGRDPAIVSSKRNLAHRVLGPFEATFDASDGREVWVHFVPGRVEVLGKHTDYAGGHSLLFALDRGFLAISARNDTGRARMVQDGSAFEPAEFPLAPGLKPVVGHWSNYPMTTASRLLDNFGKLGGVDIAFGCDLPVGGGMSGSSALMIMTFFAIARPNRLFENERFRSNVQHNLDLAMYLACVENGQTFRELVGGKGVGTFGGSEDHTEILNGRPGMLSIFRFCPTVHKADLAFPPEFGAVVAYSGVKAEKTGEALADYNLASCRAGLVVECYNRQYSTEYTLMRHLIEEGREEEDLLARIADASRSLPDAEDMDLPGRFRQFYEEDQDIIPGVACAFVGSAFDRVGDAIDRSHELSKQYLWNIVPEVDFLQKTARELGAVASSGFGAGFGGGVYAIVPRDEEERLMGAWREGYVTRFPEHERTSRFFLTRPAGSAGELFAGERRV